MALSTDLKANSVALVIVAKEKYREKSGEILKAVEPHAKKVCYVCINDPYNSTLKKIQTQGLPVEKFFFLDAVSKSAGDPPPADNCIFVSAASALTEISLALSSALNEKGCDSAFFDTLSALLVYQDAASLVQFSHDIITKIRVKGGRGVFVALKEDLKSDLLKDLYMFVDKVIEVK